MKLKYLIKDLPLTHYSGSKEVIITGISENSKTVGPGFLFIAKKGGKDDGAKYVEEAIRNGAVAICSQEPNPFLTVTQFVSDDIQKTLGDLAARFYKNPSSELFMIGVTGTNGKTTTTYLLRHLLESLGCLTGVIGTVECRMGNKQFEARLTTPDVITNHKYLREMVTEKCGACAMEVTSHALLQGRVDNIKFDVAIFTNLTHDHLDYHKTMEAYCEAKKLLFSRQSASHVAIINNEDPFSAKMVSSTKAKVLTYGFSKTCDLYAENISMTAWGTTFDVIYQNQKCHFKWSSIGRYNILNCLAAFCAMIAKGIPLSDLVVPLFSFKAAPGRLERVGESFVFVDYAHSPDALENVLKTMNEFKEGRIITVFGCGGDRDQMKRSVMGKIACTFSDLTIITSDNPRSEDPDKIIQEIAKGFVKPNYLIEPDRKMAIRKAILEADAKDLILIAGKGHENTQIFAHKKIPFDDREVAKEALTL